MCNRMWNVSLLLPVSSISYEMQCSAYEINAVLMLQRANYSYKCSIVLCSV